jgi:hypothetical protein
MAFIHYKIKFANLVIPSVKHVWELLLNNVFPVFRIKFIFRIRYYKLFQEKIKFLFYNFFNKYIFFFFIIESVLTPVQRNISIKIRFVPDVIQIVFNA